MDLGPEGSIILMIITYWTSFDESWEKSSDEDFKNDFVNF